LSVISAITPDGKLYTMTQEKAFRGPAIRGFLEHLLQHIPGKLLVVWDRLPAHRSRVIKNFLSTEDGQRLHLAQLPPYAPDLNPDEGVWNYLKRVELRNVCCHTLSELREELRKAIARLRHKTDVILGFIRQVVRPQGTVITQPTAPGGPTRPLKAARAVWVSPGASEPCTITTPSPSINDL
jgi:transposase